MSNGQLNKGVTLEVLGTCKTNTIPSSMHDAPVEYKHLWSFAQEAALIAVSRKDSTDGCYRLIQDPELRAKRIAAHYVDLYFKSYERSKGKLQIYWVALAAFVVKDIVEAFRFAREDVLQRDWKNVAEVIRNSPLADIGSLMLTEDSPYQHALRTYSALAKGNLWLFMDIYPPLWFFVEFGFDTTGKLNKQRLNSCLAERDWNAFQKECKDAVEELPYGPNWLKRLQTHLNNDIVYHDGKGFFSAPPTWTMDGGYGHHTVSAAQAHQHCRYHAKDHDSGYRTPLSNYWPKFKEAFYVMESEHKEMQRIATDSTAIETLVRLRNFKATDGVKDAYTAMISECASSNKRKFQIAEVLAIAQHEQVNVLQPLVYDDARLKETMDLNHLSSKLFGGWIAPKFKVIYSYAEKNPGMGRETVFDPDSSFLDVAIGKGASLPDQSNRMDFVRRIARDLDRLMNTETAYMERELRKIQGWLTA